MGFGFNLFVFPLLLLVSIGLVGYFFISKNKTVLKILAVLWGLIILLFIIADFKAHFDRPLRLTKDATIGNYRIDKNFYPGTNADWQYDHFRFTITPTDSIYFFVTNKDNKVKVFKDKIKYSDGPPVLWTIKGDSTYHVIRHPPTLYRGRNKFYYVFRSDKYGNMFFRKQK